MLFEEEENRMKKVDDFLENQKGTSIVLKEDEYGLPKEKVIRTTYKDNIDLLYYTDCQIVGYTSGKYGKNPWLLITIQILFIHMMIMCMG